MVVPVVAIVALALLATPEAGAHPHADFNGDGRPDLAVGVPYEGLSPSLGGSNSDEGAVDLLYSGANGPRAKGSEFLHRGLSGVRGGGPDPGAAFGTALAIDDFNGDGRQDLAIGVPGENGGVFTGPGAINVLYGGRHRLSLKRDTFLTQNTPRMAGDGGQGGDLFGYALASGDFDGDGRDDLAIGAPFETLGAGAATAQGAVTVVYGSRRGLRPNGSRFVTENSSGMSGNGASDGEVFGLLMASADLDRNGRDDLIVGAPRENVAGTNAGGITLLYGSHDGLGTKRSRSLTESSPDMPGNGAGDGDDFGGAVATGDFDRDGDVDLAVGIQFDDVEVNPGSDSGSVVVLPGSSGGPRVQSASLLTGSTPGMAGDGAEVNDAFGARLVAGDFNGDGRPDLAIGARGESLASAPGSGQGAVNVVYGSPQGLGTKHSQFIDQGQLGILGEGPENDDEFGDELAAADFNRDGKADFAVGVPLETVPGSAHQFAGAVDLIPGGRSGLRLGLSRQLDQASRDIRDRPEAGDFFGLSLSPPDGNALINVFD